MLQVLIVDDEQVERDGMKAILQKSFPSLVLHEAMNGKMAVEMARKIEPELILIDIKMPGMNGLEAFEKIIAHLPNTKFIMITAYDTYEYMRRALKLGAIDYILKPSKTNDIIETVGKVLKQIVVEKKERAKNKTQQELLKKTMAVMEADVVTQLLFEHIHEVHLDILVEFLNIETRSDMFVMNILMPKESKHLYADVKDKVKLSSNSLVGALYGNQLPIIVFRDQDKSFRSQAILLAREILSVNKSKSTVGWFVGIGKVYESLDDVKNSYQEALIASMDTTSIVKYRFHSNEFLIEDDLIEEKAKELKKNLPDQIKLGKWEEIQMKIMNYIQLFENKGIFPLQTQQRVLEVLWLASKVLNEIGIEMDTPLYSSQAIDYRQLRVETGQLLQQMKAQYVDYYGRLEADTIGQIKHYIMENSHEEITLETLGRKMGLSPIYISKMFKEKLGINYIDFLTECRIEKAKKLMANPDKSIKEIAIEVGYHEPNYFSKVFKKIVQVSPKEYQKSLLGKKV